MASMGLSRGPGKGLPRGAGWATSFSHVGSAPAPVSLVPPHVLLLLLPAWSLVALALVRRVPRPTALLVAAAVALLVAAWAGSRVGTANPVSRTGRWDPYLAFALAAAFLALPGIASTWGVGAAVAQGRPGWQAVGAGVVAGLVALPVALVLAVAVDALWPH